MNTQEKIPCGCTSLTNLLDGGFERGSITQLYGAPGAGKTNVALAAAIEVVSDDGVACIIDTEGLSAARVQQLLDGRSDVSNALEEQLLMREAYNFEDQGHAVDAVEEIGEDVDLVVLDSATGFYRLERSTEGDSDGGDMLREVGRQFTTLLGLARKHGFAVIVTNQVYNDIEDASRVTALGGNILGHWSAAMLEISERSRGGREARIEKHRSIATDGVARFEITDRGLESVTDVQLTA